jgi:two-component system sensor histidine kinase KdpD
MIKDEPQPDNLPPARKINGSAPQRGKLKIFFGQAAGVGKTYAMLVAAHSQKANGRDVVVGCIESHGNFETEALLHGFEVLRPRTGGDLLSTASADLDLNAALARRPGLILVDDLAHRNALGAPHTKRWQEVQELLEAGISIYATLNVQNLESLNDLVSQITGTVIQETIPDTVFEQADEVQLVDLTPDDLLQRIREGKVHVFDDSGRDTSSFFSKSTLIALREMAMHCVADRLDRQMQNGQREHATPGSRPVTKRILLGVKPGLHSDQLIRSTYRIAASQHAFWTAVFVDTPGPFKMSQTERNRVTRTLHLAEQLGAETMILSGRSVSRELLEFARSHNVGRIIVGRSSASRIRQSLVGSTAAKLIAQSGDIDVQVVAGIPHEGNFPLFLPSLKIRWMGIAWALTDVVLMTVLCILLQSRFTMMDIVTVYLVGVVVVASFLDLGASLLAGVLSVVAIDYFFGVPIFNLVDYDYHNLVPYALMPTAGIFVSLLTARIRQQSRAAREREQRMAALYGLSHKLVRSRGGQESIETAIAHIGETTESRVTILLSDSPDRMVTSDPDFPMEATERAAYEWVIAHGQAAGLWTKTLPDSSALYLPLVASNRTIGVMRIRPLQVPPPKISPEQFYLLEALASQTALAIERARLVEESQKAKVEIETERTRNALLSSISHDLKTPLTTITGAAGSLIEGESGPRLELLLTISEEADRLNRVISDLLDMTRLEAGVLKVRKEWQSVEGIIGATLTRLGSRLSNRSVTTHIPVDMPLVPLDSILIIQVLLNLFENAIEHTPAGTPIEFSTTVSDRQALFQIADRGPGITPGEEERVFDKFYRARPGDSGVGLGLTVCRGIVEAHGGRIWVKNREGGGALFQFNLPIEGTPPEVELEGDTID